jgi:hypothetical protein
VKAYSDHGAKGKDELSWRGDGGNGQLSVVSCQLSVVSCQLSVVSCQLSVVKYRTQR